MIYIGNGPGYIDNIDSIKKTFVKSLEPYIHTYVSKECYDHGWFLLPNESLPNGILQRHIIISANIATFL